MASMGLSGVIIVFLLIPIFLLSVLQIFLASRKNNWLGLILPILGLLWGTMVFVGARCLIPDLQGWNSTNGYDSDRLRAEIGLYVDEEDNLQAFSPLRLEDKRTGEQWYYELEFDGNGDLIGGEEALEYREIVEAINDGMGADKLVGKSTMISEMKARYRKEHMGEVIARTAGPLAAYIPFVIFLAIYLTGRKKVRRQSMAQEVEKMMIDDL